VDRAARLTPLTEDDSLNIQEFDSWHRSFTSKKIKHFLGGRWKRKKKNPTGKFSLNRKEYQNGQ
jgi:hypothetical protein